MKAFRPTIREIQSAVASHYGLHPDDMTSPCRLPHVSHPRQLAMWLARGMAGQSLPKIARKFGNRHHTTVMYALRQVDERIRTDREICAAQLMIRKQVARIARRRVRLCEQEISL